MTRIVIISTWSSSIIIISSSRVVVVVWWSKWRELGMSKGDRKSLCRLSTSTIYACVLLSTLYRNNEPYSRSMDETRERRNGGFELSQSTAHTHTLRVMFFSLYNYLMYKQRRRVLSKHTQAKTLRHSSVKRTAKSSGEFRKQKKERASASQSTFQQEGDGIVGRCTHVERERDFESVFLWISCWMYMREFYPDNS